MLKHFTNIVNDMKGQINKENWSALIAVSGGMDSMCLADMWLRAFGTDCCAFAHCNFNLRAEESDGDEAMVTQWAEKKGVRLHKVSFDTIGYASRNGVSIEMAARDLRYGWFAELCQQNGYSALVTAHHCDDNAETLVLNLVRGTGLRGLSGMRPLSFGQGGIPVLRPLLSFTRKQIEGYVFAWKIPYREDSTNSSVEYRRNSVRHEIFPLFERMNPSYVRTLNREMTYFNEASEIVEEWCRSQAPKVLNEDGSISVADLLSVHHWRYLLYYILEPYGFHSSVLESIEDLLTSGRTVSGKRFQSKEYVLLTERESLIVMPLSEYRPQVHVSDIFVQVPAIGTYHINGARVVVERLEWNIDMPLKQPEGVLIMDADKLKFPFVLRKWRQGDWMIPLGMRGRKKLSDMFADYKFTQVEKESAVVLVDLDGGKAEDQHVAALVGKRSDNSYKVTEKTKEIIRITLS